jgi:hypothetical protein
VSQRVVWRLRTAVEHARDETELAERAARQRSR